jgi:exopolysaccharide biosynthesis WecB/TagA/CpsF family protein
MRTDRINFLDVHFDRLSFRDVDRLLRSAGSASPYAYVVTPNVDHVVRIHREPGLRQFYDAADLCVCDSRILQTLARWRGIKLPLVAGSDLCRSIFDLLQSGDTIAIVGSSQADVAKLRSRFPEVAFTHHEPPPGLRENPEARSRAAAFVAASKARFALLAVGSPQQEMIAKEVRDHDGASGIALCIGAGLDFVTGKQKRAPRLMQRLHLEWVHRLATNPRRLWRRYLVEDMAIFPIYLRWRPRSGWPLRTMAVVLASGVLAVAIYATGFPSLPSWPRSAATSTSRLPPATMAKALATLPPPNLLRPISPEEASKENAERPFVERPDTPASRFVLRTDSEDRSRALECLAQAVYYEAASEGTDGGRAVAQVVLNRMRHPGYPSSVCGVVYEGADRTTGCQFTFTCDGSLLRTPIASLWNRSRKIAEEALAGRVFAPVGHATHYHADYVLPYWADSLDKTVQIGRHIFYRLRSSLGDKASFFQRYAGREPALPTLASPTVIPSEAVTQELANALISDGAASKTPDVEKASASPSSPLLIDSSKGTLLADAAGAPTATKKSKAANACPATSDRKQLAPLGATNMHAGATAAAC